MANVKANMVLTYGDIIERLEGSQKGHAELTKKTFTIIFTAVVPLRLMNSKKL